MPGRASICENWTDVDEVIFVLVASELRGLISGNSEKPIPLINSVCMRILKRGSLSILVPRYLFDLDRSMGESRMRGFWAFLGDLLEIRIEVVSPGLMVILHRSNRGRLWSSWFWRRLIVADVVLPVEWLRLFARVRLSNRHDRAARDRLTAPRRRRQVRGSSRLETR